jgi:hypothetical protein
MVYLYIFMVYWYTIWYTTCSVDSSQLNKQNDICAAVLIISSSHKIYYGISTSLLMQGKDALIGGIALSDNVVEQLSESRTTSISEKVNTIEKFNGQYDKDLRGSFWGEKGIFTIILGFLPFFKWVENKVIRSDQPPTEKIMKPGLLSYRIVLDGLFIRWLGYLDAAPGDEDFDPTPGLENEYTNTGILSALLLTVWVTFKQMTDLDFENESVEVAYHVFWTVAVVLAIMSTILSVLMLLMINETSGVEERTHFVAILDNDTFGLGTHGPVIFLYFSLVSSVFGFTTWLAVVHGNTSYSFFISVACLLCFGVTFWIFVLYGVRSLYTCRHTQAKLQGKTSKLTVAAIKRKLEDCIIKQKGFENIPSEKDFLAFIKETNDETTGLPYQESYCDTTLEIAKQIFKNRLKSISA